MKVIYLDHAACTKPVAAAIDAFRTAPFGNPSSEHAVGQAARDALEQAREKIAKKKAYVQRIREKITSCSKYHVYPETTIRLKGKPPTFIDYLIDADLFTVGVEVKSSVNDLYSGYGRNFVCDLNYLICPPDAIAAAARLLDRMNRRDVGIIVFGRGRTTIVRSAEWMYKAPYGKFNNQIAFFLGVDKEFESNLCNALL